MVKACSILKYSAVCGWAGVLIAGGMVRVTMDFGLSLSCAPCHRTVCRGAGMQLTGGEIR